MRVAGGCLSPVWKFMQLRPCRTCDVCRRNDQWQWEQRGQLEAKFAPKTIFLTLTFRPRSGGWLPTDQEVWPDVDKYLKRMRKAGHSFRYLAAPELGDRNGRHHYHLLLHTSSAALPFRRNWKQGFTHARHASKADIRYVAEYAAKQSGRKRASLGYGTRDLSSALEHDMVTRTLQLFPRARIRAVDGITLPSKVRKTVTPKVEPDNRPQPLFRSIKSTERT